MRVALLLVILAGCPGKEAEAPKQIDVAKWLDCPQGSTYDPAKNICVANPPPPPPTVEKDAGAPIPIAVAPDAGTEPAASTATGNVIVKCDFAEGWVTLLPIAAYPKDDSFLMQSLIGLTEDPKFWIGAGYAKLSTWKAKKCPKTGVGFAISSGDYWILAGQANQFNVKGKYDRNGYRKKQTFAIGTTPITIDLKPADLTHTWLCISCPWVLAPGADAFTALRDRDEKKKHGTDTIPLHGLVVENDRVRIRVAERERETTFLDAMALVKNGKRFLPTAKALHADDGFDVRMARGTEITVEFQVEGPGEYALEITGHYEPEQPPWVVDLHVDLPWSLFAKRDLPEVDADRLARGNVRTLVTPLFVEHAFEMTPAKAREAYEADFRALLAAKPPVATRLAFEGADGFADDPKKIDPWIAKGACFVGLVHSRTNALAGSATEPDPKKRRGLTEKGKLLAAHVLEAGGLLDVAHASDAAFDDLAAIAAAAKKPLVDTHTGMRALVAIDRNLSDEHAKVIASSGGVIGLSMHSGHVTPRAGETATLEEYVAQIEHAASVAGHDHVAIGSDLAGAIRPPAGSDGAATWPILAGILRDRGWSDEHIAALFHENAERILGQCQPQMQ